MHYSKSKMCSKLKECTVHTLLTLHSYLLPLFVASLPAGTILCSVGYESGQVKVFSVSVGLAWGGSEFSLSASLATELHQMSSQSGEHTHTHTHGLCTPRNFTIKFPSYPLPHAEQITSMLMLPLSDGCEVHLCYNSEPKWYSHVFVLVAISLTRKS